MTNFKLLIVQSIQQMKDFDGKTYKTVIIGNQEWMSENLNVEHFLNGDLITEARSSWEWQNVKKKVIQHGVISIIALRMVKNMENCIIGLL